jgi:aminopeptidase YwaD
MKIVKKISSKGIGMINLDMIGVGDTHLIGNIGLSSSSLTNYIREKASAMNLNWQPFTAESNSDHTYFEAAGVPAVFIYQSSDPWYHTSEDTIDKINVVNLEQNGELATTSMYDWAKNPAHREKKAIHLEKVHVYHDKVYAGK